MRRRKILLDEIVFDGCDKRFEKAIEVFIEKLNETPSYTLLSRRYSVFSLMRRHLDVAFTELEERYEVSMYKGVLTPSKLKYPRFLSEGQQNYYIGLTPHRRITFSLNYWAEFIGNVIKNGFERNSAYIAALDSLKMLVQTLVLWCSDGRESLNLERVPSKSKARTKKHIQPKNRHCALCWRPLNYTSGDIDESRYGTVNKIQTKYCYHHDRTGNFHNYVRDRRYIKSFDREYASLTKREDSNYHPNASWYISTAREKGYAVGVTEIRKIIYFLIRSGLDTPRRKEVYAMHEDGNSLSEISRRLGVTRQAVHKTIKQIDLKMAEVINCVAS